MPLAPAASSTHDAAPPTTSPVNETRIQKVWIEAGCISCQLCQDIAPQVFRVEDGQDCVVKPDAARHFRGCRDDIEQAAKDCPVEVIKLEVARSD